MANEGEEGAMNGARNEAAEELRAEEGNEEGEVTRQRDGETTS